jgi:putative transcriptional regulator
MVNDMDDEIFEKVMQGADEALAHVKGETVRGMKFHRVRVSEVDVAELRRRLGLSQRAFASEFGFTVHAVRHWEQGQRRPTGSARTLLRVIDHDPEHVREALKASAERAAEA